MLSKMKKEPDTESLDSFGSKTTHKFFLSIDYDFVYFEQTMGEKMLVEGKISFHLSRKTQFKSWNH